MRILFVEDNDMVRLLIGELMAEDGREVVACRSAEEAEMAFDKEHFDVVVTDINLPARSGTELARHLMNKRADVWVVFSSGTKFDLADSWGPRVRTLSKPFDGDDLARLFDEIARINAAAT